MQPLGDHLCPDQNIHLALAKLRKDALVIFLLLQGVRVHASKGGPRVQFDQRFLHPFGSHTGKTNLGALTCGLWAAQRSMLIMTTEMTSQALLATMVGQRHTALRTPGNESTLGALQRGSITASIQKKHRLLFFFQSLLDGLLQLLR